MNKRVIGVFAIAGLGFWAHTVYKSLHSEKCHSSIFKSAVHYLRYEPRAIETLGKEIHHDMNKHSIKGSVNIFKGEADLIFDIEGDLDMGTVELKAKRIQKDLWDTQMKLSFRNGELIQF
jgi:hypothetical protein